MSLPAWNADGLLPPGRYPATLDDIYERFVMDAPERPRREILHGAFVTHLMMVRSFIPAGKVWVDGGFSMQKAAPPHDVDVAIIPDDYAALAALPVERQIDFLGLMTLRDVVVGDPGPLYLDRIQPVGGALDAFICHPGEEYVWHSTWSSVKGTDGKIIPGMTKGYAEVSW